MGGEHEYCRVKTVATGHGFSLAVPESWTIGREGDDWTCSEPDDLATLRLDTHYFLLPEPTTPPVAVEMYVERFLDVFHGKTVLGDIEATEVAEVRLIYATIDEGGGDTGNILHWWCIVTPLADRLHVAHFRLVLMRGLADGPMLTVVTALFDAQIRALARETASIPLPPS